MRLVASNSRKSVFGVDRLNIFVKERSKVRGSAGFHDGR
jgi:hypothetical protein